MSEPQEDSQSPDSQIPGAKIPRWIPQLVVALVVGVLVLLAILSAIQQLGDFIKIVVAAVFLTFALEPAVQFLGRHHWKRSLAALTVLVVIVVGAVSAVAIMAPVFIDQLRMLIDHAPDWLARLSTYTDKWLGLNLDTAKMNTALQDASKSLLGMSGDVVGKVFGVGAAVLAGLFNAFTVLLFTYYLLADGPRLRRAVLSFLPEQHQRDFLWLWETSIDKVGGYLYSRALLATVSTICAYIAMKVMGLPYALPLSIFMGVVSQFIPTVGTYIGAALPVAVALLVSPEKGLILILYVAVYQQIENYLLSPPITAHTMELHAGVAFGSVIVGASLFGAIGAFLALPVVAVIQAWVETFVKRHRVLEMELQRAEEPSAAARGPSLRARLTRRIKRKN